MHWNSTHLSLQETGYFSRIITDYLNRADTIKPFYQYESTLEGIRAAIENRKKYPTNRRALTEILKKQYETLPKEPATLEHIEALLDANTFTIATAHQPAIFTGALYFIYKIIHVIRLSRYLSAQLPGYRFVPVFYMGSEDADLEELGKIYLDREKLVWETTQRGAVGRMKTTGLESILDRIKGEYAPEPFGAELIELLNASYLGSPDIQTATLKLIHSLFGSQGLVALIADNPMLKREMLPVFEDDLFNQKPSAIVAKTIAALSAHYKVQARPREINLFYLKDDLRGRIEKVKEQFLIHESALRFDEQGLREELHRFPERFSPNVILRGLYQETILPNIVFVGGAGETAYWLELKDLFAHYGAPFPVLVLRNSFLIISKKWNEKMGKAGLGLKDLFRDEEKLVEERIRQESANQLSLQKEIEEASVYYKNLERIGGRVDPSLANHVRALHARAVKPLLGLEKKLLRAEKRKHVDRQRQIRAIKSSLFPLQGLQERIENFMPYYAAMGREFLDTLYKNSLSLEQDFTILQEV